jgi:survival-of-motor-neuron-related-splicing factor 30
MEPTVREISAKLEEYKENRVKVIQALQKNETRTQDEDSKILREKELKKLLNDIEKAISIQQELLTVSSNNIEKFFTSVKLKTEDIGKKCNLYYEKDSKWYPGEINSVNLNEQTAEVTFFGFHEKHLLPASYISILKPLKRNQISEGLDVEVLLDDGKWHFAAVEDVHEDNVLVKIARWGQKQMVSLDALRLVQEENKPLLEKEVFVIPDKLKILPNDPENVRIKKKKKIKALRTAWKNSQTEKETKFYTSSWKNFQKTGNVKKNSMFRCPEVFDGKIGVVGSGKGMTKDHDKRDVKDLVEDQDPCL